MRNKRTLRSRESAILLTACLLSGCTTKAVIPLSIVTEDIEKCDELKLSKIPKRDLTEAEVEKLYKHDRYVAVRKGQCLRQMIAGDQVQSGKK